MAHVNLDAADGRRLLWINYLDYAGKLLAGGNIQWLDIAECLNWYRKAQGLLKSDILNIDISYICTQFIESDAALLNLMRGKDKSIAPLKELLSYPPLRAHISELVMAARATFPDLMLALVCPAPGGWVKTTYLKAFPESSQLDIGEDEVDYGALYTADFLRIFSGANVDLLLLEDGKLTKEHAEEFMPCYQTIMNLANQYRWRFGIQFSEIVDRAELPLVDFIVSKISLDGPIHALELDQKFWDNPCGAEHYKSHFLYVSIPISCEPEIVLDSLNMLRNSAS